jgi:6-phosphogluconate dehydrogenase
MTEDKEDKSVIGVFGMGVMGQNLALNVASKSFKVSCYNREDEFSKRLFEALEIAKRDISNGDDLLRVFKDLNEFVDSLKKPRYVLLCFLFLSFVVVLHRSVCCSM